MIPGGVAWQDLAISAGASAGSHLVPSVAAAELPTRTASRPDQSQAAYARSRADSCRPIGAYTLRCTLTKRVRSWCRLTRPEASASEPTTIPFTSG